jgi:8-oxo-dGTP pyrophosphatase MutT (NUDIX family)
MSNDTKDLLLEDYRYRAESLWKNEQGGETRVNLFIGLITLVGGLMATLLTSENHPLKGEALRFFVVAGLFSMLLLGIVTMLRMMSRNKRTDEAKRDLDVIRQAFKDRFDEDGMLLHYNLFAVPPGKKPVVSGEQDNRQPQSSKVRDFGGLAHTMAAVNSLLFAGLIAALLFSFQNGGGFQDAASPFSPLLVLIFALLASGLGLSLQVWTINRQEAQVKQKLQVGLPTHAGGIVFRWNGEQVEYLLVRPKSGVAEWVLPKGHIESNEGHGEAAVREVCEETGIFARPICLVDRVRFTTPKGETVDAKFYLMEKVYEAHSPEGRQIQWISPGHALEQLTHAESRYLVQAAERIRSMKADHAR